MAAPSLAGLPSAPASVSKLPSLHSSPSTPPQHSKHFLEQRQRYSTANYKDLLAIFDIRQIRGSVTRARREEAGRQQSTSLQQLTMDEPPRSPSSVDELEILTRDLDPATRRAMGYDVPDVPRMALPKLDPMATSAHKTVNTTVSKALPLASPRATSGLASMYSEEIFDDDQDWSLTTRPAFLDQPKPISPTTPTTPSTAKSDLTFESIDDDLDDVTDFPTIDRTTLTGKSLRPRSSLSATAAKLGFSLKNEYEILSSYTPPRRKPVKKVDTTASPSALTSRNIIRQQIAQITKAKRDRFIASNASLFLPLLPDKNYVRNTSHINAYSPISAYREVSQPKGLNAIMKPYQLKGLSFLVHMHNNGMPAILADEMGLGKTLQTLSLFQHLTEKKLQLGEIEGKEIRPFLVICPLSVLENWVNEAKKFTPNLRVLRFHGPAAEREYLKDELRQRKTQSAYTRDLLKHHGKIQREYGQGYDIVITTYEAFDAESQWFKTVAAWRYVVLDEGHRIKNYKTKSSKNLQSLQAEYRLILTGTPLQNNLVEMWSLFHWLLPDVFPEQTLALFKNAFDLTKGHVDRAVLDHSRRLLELIMIRRMKSTQGVDLNLPTKTIIRLFVPLTDFQKKWYLQLLTQQSDDVLAEIYKDATSKEQDLVKSASRQDSAWPSAESTPTPARTVLDEEDLSTPKTPTKDPWRRLLNLVLQLRKVCTHAYLIPTAAPDINMIGPHVYENSGKFAALHKLVTELVLKQGKKMIIFSQFVEVLDWVHDLMTLISEDDKHFQCLRLDGNLVRAKRNLYVRLFQRDDAYKIFLISTKAGGIGLNLTAATEVVFMDEDWNPQVDLQAEARCHRIGQTKPVTIYKLCTAGSVEEQMLGRIHKKLYLSAKITESMQNVHDAPVTADADNLTIAEGQKMFGSFSEFKSLLRRGTKTLTGAGPDAKELLDWDFETMIEKCQRQTDIAEDEVDDKAEENWLSTMEKVECAIFDGKRYQREKATWQDSVETPVSARSERRKGKELTVMVDGFAVNKESLECKQWESVATLAGKDPALKNPTRTREPFDHQLHCQKCFQDKEDGPIIECNNCPRVYHEHCMTREEVKTAKAFGSWSCSQHYCHECEKRSAEAGGMIFRYDSRPSPFPSRHMTNRRYSCRWCAYGYCEDCLDWDKTRLVGDTIHEYKILKFPIRREAYYVICQDCNVPGIIEGLDQQGQEWEQEPLPSTEAEQGAERIGEADSVTESELDRKIMDSVEDIMEALPTGNLITPKKMREATMTSTASPTPDLTQTTRTTAEPEPQTPKTPTEGASATDTGMPPTPTPSKRKSMGTQGSSQKKRKKYYEIEV